MPAERLAFLRRSLARARAQSQEHEAQRAQREKALAEAYAQRREQQIAQRREERQARLHELQQKARPPPRSPELEAEKDPEVSALLAQRPSLKRRLRPALQGVLSPRSAEASSPPSSPRKPAVPKPPPQRAAARPPEEAPSAQQPQMPRKEHLRATQHQLLNSCGVVLYKQQMKAHFRRILEAVEVGYGASAGHQKMLASKLSIQVLGVSSIHSRRQSRQTHINTAAREDANSESVRDSFCPEGGICVLLPQLPGRAPLLIGLRWLEWNTFCEIQDVTKELRTLSLWTSLVEPNVSTHQVMAVPNQGTCELLRAFINPDAATRTAAEERLKEAIKGAPNELVKELLAVLLAFGENGAPPELRSEAVVLLRQCATESSSRACWEQLEPNTKQAVQEQILVSMTKDPSNPVRRQAGHVVSTIANSVAENCEELMKAWPQLLPFLSSTISAGSDASQVTACLQVLQDMVELVGEELLTQGPQAVAMLQTCLNSSRAEVQAAAAQLALEMVADLEKDVIKPLGALMPSLLSVMKSFAVASDHEELLKETLESLISAADEEPEFFKENGLQQVWPLLLEMCRADHWGDAQVRHSAMEAAMSFFEGLCEDFCKAEGQPFLEQLILLNLEWMLEVEENVDTWIAGADQEEEDIDEDLVDIGEENMDRLAQQCAEKDALEEAFMPTLFKVLRAVQAAPTSSWKHTRSCVMAVSQVVEYIQEEAWVDQCIEFLVPHTSHAHPRVRYSAFQAVGQTAYDHDPYVAENHAETLLPLILGGLDDQNIRVATSAASALSSMEDMDEEDLEPHMEALMTKLFTRLEQGQSQAMQETCLSAIAVVGEAASELFLPYYGHVMPALKQLIANSSKAEQKSLRGKAFECASLLGEGVGKEVFAADGHEIMQIMVRYIQAGFDADDQTREYVHEAAGRVAGVLAKDFKPYVPVLLPSLLKVLQQQPKEVALEEDEEEFTQVLADGKLIGLKTAVLDEMAETLTLIASLMGALEEEFVEFLPDTCRQLMPLLDFPVSEDVQDKANATWEHVVHCARTAAENGKCEPMVVGQLVGEFLKNTVAMMTKFPGDKKDQGPAALSQLQGQASAMAGVIKKAGRKVLAKQDVIDLVKVLAMLLTQVKIEDEPAEAAPKKKSEGKAHDSDEEESDSEEGSVSRQSVRFSLVDVAGALMRASREEFAEVGLTVFMELVRRLLQNGSDSERSLALYIANEVVACLGELSVPHWNTFMEHACNSITDKTAVIRQHSASVIGHGSQQAIFAQIAPLAASQLARVLAKHGERHRRRRAVNSEAKQVAAAVDASIWALGMICEHQEKNVGGDSTGAWQMWLSHMPPRYDKEIGQKASAQLLELVVKNHPVVTAPKQLPRVLAVFADVYKSKNSNSVLDKDATLLSQAFWAAVTH
ncbi:IPO5 [Symbiodinium pilosum]|uniref:IPO5 protein n=1 Tax=Symbiodinium pilosum TaxID=2952 RepID=A0A812PZF9_SYMPI|nr:IPO5 [Symbiodinium pilosum]